MFPNIFISLMVTIIGYTLIPVLILLSCEKKPSKKKIIITLVINSLFVFIIFCAIGDHFHSCTHYFFNGAPAIFWSGVCFIVINCSLNKKFGTKNTAIPKPKNFVSLTTTEDDLPSSMPSTEYVIPTSTTASLIGSTDGNIPATTEPTVQTTFSKTAKLVITLLCCCIVAFGVFSGYLLDKNNTLKEQVAAKIYTNKVLQNKLNEKTTELSFWNEHAVIVADDGTKKYHKYGCEDLGLSYFWIYNSEAAEGMGYKPCSKCN